MTQTSPMRMASIQTEDNHPRIIFTDRDFKDIKKAVARNDNPILTNLHRQLMRTAEEEGLTPWVQGMHVMSP